MHPGHARTALVTWLQARKHGGRIVMRIEDIDRPRVVPGSADAICRDHEWLGLDWDEGPVFQSSHDEAYERALRRLEAAGMVYPCTCSRKEIAAIASAPHGDDGLRYPGTCRSGVTQPGKLPAFRFVFEDPSPGFEDALCGTYPEGRTGGDFVLRRADGIWAYQLAVVVDDAEAGISEVIRGEDLLSSTPRQIAPTARLAIRFRASRTLAWWSTGTAPGLRRGTGRHRSSHFESPAVLPRKSLVSWRAHSG